MAKDMRAWDEYTSTPIIRSQASFNEELFDATLTETSLPTDQELAAKAKKLGLIDGLPFTYFASNNLTLTELDLHSIEIQFEVIRQTCKQLAPYHKTFIPQLNGAMKVDMAGKYGFIHITYTLRKKLQSIYDFIKNIDNQLTENSQEIIEAISSTQTGKEKLQLIHVISGLIWTFRREYFNDIPVFLKTIADSPEGSLYLFDYEQMLEEPYLPEEIKTEIKQLAGERAELRINGEAMIEEIDNLVAHIKQYSPSIYNEDDREDPQTTGAWLQQEIDDLRAQIQQRNLTNTDTDICRVVAELEAAIPKDSTDAPIESAIESVHAFKAKLEQEHDIKIEECSIKSKDGFIMVAF